MNQAKPLEATHVGYANSTHGKPGGNGKEPRLKILGDEFRINLQYIYDMKQKIISPRFLNIIKNKIHAFKGGGPVG